jgi:small-conductance mechanosensitive channel
MRPALVDLSVDSIADWSSVHVARIAMVVALAVAANVVLRRVVPPAIRAAVLRDATPRTEVDLRKRADTLGNVLINTTELAVIVIGAFVVLDELGYNVAPFLTGLGIGGLALGLGAQSLVRDMLNGVFILIENQYGRGDLVTIAGVQGWVEEVNLRRTVIRDADGTLFTIPNSEVKVSGNLTRGYSGINLLVPLTAASDVDRAMALIDEAGQEIAADPHLGPLVVEAPRAVRVEALTDKGLTLRVLGKVVPGSQFEVAGALRHRIKRSFDAAEIRFGEPAPPPPAPAPTAAAPRPPA